MNTAALALLAEWGEPFLFVLLFFAALGLPLPATLSLIAAGALTATGVIDGYSTVIWSVCGAVLGDHAGYLVGRVAGPTVQARLERRPTMARHFETARTRLTKRGIAGIFLSRWLLTPLGPPVNIAAGITAFPLVRFLLADIAGEIVWVALYFSIGAFAGAGVEELSQAASDFSWLALAAAVTIALGWAAFRRRPKSAGD